MDIIQRITKQFFELYRSMSPSQRGTLIAVPLLVVGGFAVLLWSNRASSESALSYGKIFTTEESMAVEQALQKAQLTNWRRVGGQIMVPANEVTRYNAALVELDAMPTDLGSQMLKQLNSMGPFSTDKQRQEMKEAMLLQEIRRTLNAVQDVADARVVVANPTRRSTWGSKTQTKATVFVKLKGGRELSPKQVHLFRSAVANMVPDLQQDAVTVVDWGSDGKSYTGDTTGDPFDSKLMQRVQEFTQHYQHKIENELSYIPNVGVTVQVDVDNIKSSVTRSQTVDPKNKVVISENEYKTTDKRQQTPQRNDATVRQNQPASLSQSVNRVEQSELTDTSSTTMPSVKWSEESLIAAMPKAVQVSVNIPRDYYRDVADQRKEAGEQDAAKTNPEEIERIVLAAVQKSVKQLVPLGSPDTAVVVKSIDRIVVNTPEPQIPWSERTLVLVREWGGTAGLAIFAMWVLWTLRKMAPAAPAVSEEPELDPFESKRMKLAASNAAEEVSESKPKEPTRRDLIQTIVKDNPEMTAAVIGKWLQAAK